MDIKLTAEQITEGAIIKAEISAKKKKAPTGGDRRIAVVHIDPVSGVEILTLLHPTNANAKTGSGYAITHLRADMHPIDSRRQHGDSETVCRGCEYADGNGCYVNPMQLGSIYRAAVRNGSYYRCNTWEEFIHHAVECASYTRFLRFGNFGNPTMMPAPVVSAITAAIKEKNIRLKELREAPIRWTGYFRDWKVTPKVQYAYHDNFMYSCMSAEELVEIDKVNGRAFWSVPASNVPQALLIASAKGIRLRICPEQTHGVQCRDCGLCMGARPGTTHILMPIHGNGEKKAVAAQAKLAQSFDC